MSDRAVARVIAITYAVMLGFWLATMPLARRIFAQQPKLLDIDAPRPPRGRAQESGPAAGVLLVFLVNIAIEMLFIGSLFSRHAGGWLTRLRFPLPRALRIAGACLFVADKTWGTLTLFFNPGYSPFFGRWRSSARLATRGPYAVVRHPRYAGEAALNLILPLLTGAWAPLLGLLGWRALGRQAEIEETELTEAMREEYARYRARTGRFLPRECGSRFCVGRVGG